MVGLNSRTRDGFRKTALEGKRGVPGQFGIVCLQAGLVLWLLRLSRMGGLVNLLSHPVITGFVNAAAILIIISQLPAFTGLDVNDMQPLVVLSTLLAKCAKLTC